VFRKINDTQFSTLRLEAVSNIKIEVSFEVWFK